jgi:hydrogenase maturation factor
MTMSKLNNEDRELSLEELNEVTGGDLKGVITSVGAWVTDHVDYVIGKLTNDPYYSRI